MPPPQEKEFPLYQCESFRQLQNCVCFIVVSVHNFVQCSEKCANYLALQKDHCVTVRLSVMHANCFERLEISVERSVHSLLAICLFLFLEPFVASSSADPIAVLIPIDVAVVWIHVAFHQRCPRVNLKAAWTLWNCTTPVRQEGILKVRHVGIANVIALVTLPARHV